MKKRGSEEYTDKIYFGKWEDVMPTLPSNFVDLIVTSPPYNVNLGKNKFKKDSYDSYDDNMPYREYLQWMEKLFYACNRVLKEGGRLCVNIGDGANGQVPTHADFTHLLVGERNDGKRMTEEDCYYDDIKKSWVKGTCPDLKPFQMMTTIVWNKRQIGASTAWGSFQSPSQPSFPTPFEFIIVVGKGSLHHDGDKRKISISKEDFIENSRSLWSFLPETQMMKRFGHPAAFPEELPKRLIDHLTYEDDVVLDPFSGTGTTCAVAKKMNRHFMGIEMSEKYYKTSLARLMEIPSMSVIVDKDGNESCIPSWME